MLGGTHATGQVIAQRFNGLSYAHAYAEAREVLMRERGVVVRAVIITVIELQLFPSARLPAPY